MSSDNFIFYKILKKLKNLYLSDCVYIGPSTTSTLKPMKPIEFCAPNDGIPNPEHLGPFMIIVKCKPSENCVPLRKPFGKLNYG